MTIRPRRASDHRSGDRPVLRRCRLGDRAVAALVIGLVVACVVGGVLTRLLSIFDLLPAGFDVGQGNFLQGLSSVNISTPIVALAAGVAGMLALETRASSAVGVAISVTTIPASADLGVAAGVKEVSKAFGALLVVGVNVVMLLRSSAAAARFSANAGSRPGAAPHPEGVMPSVSCLGGSTR